MHFADFLTLLSITVLSKYVNINTCRKHVTMWGIVNYSSQGQKDVINSFILILFLNDFPSKITFISMEFIQNFLSIGLARKVLDKYAMYQKFTCPIWMKNTEQNISTKIVEKSLCIIIIYWVSIVFCVHDNLFYSRSTACCDRQLFSSPQLFSYWKIY